MNLESCIGKCSHYTGSHNLEKKKNMKPVLPSIAIAASLAFLASLIGTGSFDFNAHAQGQGHVVTAEDLRDMPCTGGDDDGGEKTMTYHMPQGIPEEYRIISGYTTRGSVEILFAGYKDCPRITQEKALEDGAIYYAEHRLFSPFSQISYFEKTLIDIEKRYEQALTVSKYNGHPMFVLDQSKIGQDASGTDSEIPRYSQLRYVNEDQEYMITIRTSGDPSRLVRILDMTLNPSGPIKDHTRTLKLDEFSRDLWHESYLIAEAKVTGIKNSQGPYLHTYEIRMDDTLKPIGGFIGSETILVHGTPSFDIGAEESGIFFINRENARFVFGEHGDKMIPGCTADMMYHKSRLLHPSVENVHESTFNTEDALHCYPVYYRQHLPEFIKAHEATVPSPSTQVSDGILPYHVICKEGLSLLLKPPGYEVPACVKKTTFNELVTRGWSVTFSWR